MVLALKSLLSLAGAGTVAVGGYGIHYAMNREPKALSLNQAGSQPPKGKSWNQALNRDRAVANVEDNGEWWSWKFKNSFDVRRASLKLDEGFSRVNREFGIGKNAEEGLNNACARAYEQEAVSETLKLNLEKFCYKTIN